MIEPITWNIFIVVIVGVTSFLSTGVALITNWRSNRKISDEEAASLTSMKKDIEHIRETTDNSKTLINVLDEKLDRNTERLVKVEESTKQAHKRINTIEEKLH